MVNIHFHSLCTLHYFFPCSAAGLSPAETSPENRLAFGHHIPLCKKPSRLVSPSLRLSSWHPPFHRPPSAPCKSGLLSLLLPTTQAAGGGRQALPGSQPLPVTPLTQHPALGTRGEARHQQGLLPRLGEAESATQSMVGGPALSHPWNRRAEG